MMYSQVTKEYAVAPVFTYFDYEPNDVPGNNGMFEMTVPIFKKDENSAGPSKEIPAFAREALEAEIAKEWPDDVQPDWSTFEASLWVEYNFWNQSRCRITARYSAYVEPDLPKDSGVRCKEPFYYNDDGEPQYALCDSISVQTPLELTLGEKLDLHNKIMEEWNNRFHYELKREQEAQRSHLRLV